MRREQTARLVIKKQARALSLPQRLAIHGNAVRVGHVERGRIDDFAIHAHPPRFDPCFGRAARGEPGARDHLGDARAAPGTIIWLVSHLQSSPLRPRRDSKVALACRDALGSRTRRVMGNMRTQSFMGLALEQARAAAAAGEVPIGCVVVAHGRVIAEAGNRTLIDRDPTAHAELIALRQAMRALGSERLIDCDLHVTLEPCTMCAAAISLARIRRLYYGASDPKGGAVENGVRFFSAPTCLHRPEVVGGIAEQEAATLLRGFFVARR